MVVISRDVIIVLTVAIINLAVGPRTFRPSVFGKVATAIYVVTTVVVMSFNYLEQESSFVDVCIYSSLVIALISGLHYIAHAARVVNQRCPQYL